MTEITVGTAKSKAGWTQLIRIIHLLCDQKHYTLHYLQHHQLYPWACIVNSRHVVLVFRDPFQVSVFFFTELPAPLQEFIRTLNCCYFYIILVFWALQSHYWTVGMPYYFYKVSFLYISIILQVHFACMLYVSCHWRIIYMMTDGVNFVLI